MQLARQILAPIIGVILAGIVIAALEAGIHVAFDGMAVFATVALAYGLGAFAGTVSSAIIARSRLSGVIVALALAALAIFNLSMFDHPTWFVPLAAAFLALGWWLGDRLYRRRHLT